VFLGDSRQGGAVSNIGLKQRQVGNVTILDTNHQLRIGLRFGGSGFSLTNAVDSLLEENKKQILLNLAGVTSIDARGLGELVSTHIVVNEKGGQFKIFNLTQALLSLMSTTKLLTVFDVYDSESQALDSFTESRPQVATGTT
jgi:anti-sigma B factor antagonist